MNVKLSLAAICAENAFVSVVICSRQPLRQCGIKAVSGHRAAHPAKKGPLRELAAANRQEPMDYNSYNMIIISAWDLFVTKAVIFAGQSCSMECV